MTPHELAAVRNSDLQVIPQDAPLTAGEIRAQVNLIQEVMHSVMREGEHYGKVPGCGDKPTLLQPGAQKLILTFRLVPDPDVTMVDMPKAGHREYRIKMKLYTRGMNGEERGTFLGAGVGNCSTMESKYRYRTGPVEYTDKPVPKEYWDLRNSDPAKAKALLGAGYVAKKNDVGRWVCAVQGEKVEYDNPADYYNTCEKIAYKRALVSATLTVTAASDIFTQDIEEMEDLVIPSKSVAMPIPPVMPLKDKPKAKVQESKPVDNHVDKPVDKQAAVPAQDPASEAPVESRGQGSGGLHGGPVSEEQREREIRMRNPRAMLQDLEEQAAPGGARSEALSPAGDEGRTPPLSGSGPSEDDLLTKVVGDLMTRMRLSETAKEMAAVRNQFDEIDVQGGVTPQERARFQATEQETKKRLTLKKK